MSKPSKCDEMTNSPWAILYAVPALLVACFAVILAGVFGLLKWAVPTAAGMFQRKERKCST